MCLGCELFSGYSLPSWITDRVAWQCPVRELLLGYSLPSWMTDRAAWKYIQGVSYSQAIPCQVGWLTRLCEIATSSWVALGSFPANWLAKKSSWICDQFVGCSLDIPCQVGWLTRLRENLSSSWVVLRLFPAKSDDWQGCIKMCPESELLSGYSLPSRMTDTASREWVALRLLPAKLDDWRGCLKRIQGVSCPQAIPCQVGWLTRLSENVTRKWVALRLFSMTDKAAWKCVQRVSFSQPIQHRTTHNAMDMFSVGEPFVTYMDLLDSFNVISFSSSTIVCILAKFSRLSSTSCQTRHPHSEHSLVCNHLWCCSLLIFCFAAILLCAENSFWYKSRCSSFLDAFKQAVELYVEIGVEKNGENAVKALGDWPTATHEQEIYRSALTNIVLEHRLRASNRVLIAIRFWLLSFLQHAQTNQATQCNTRP